ncbi:MAG TPA: MarR family transcriptional regulator [Verrucomicrobiae bacterium]|nr:MarR family transcriptional regulator [Verrucomicrobiae bacterium]
MAQVKPLSKRQHERLAAFRYALRRFLRFSEEAAQAAGLTPQQHQALLAIKGYPGRECVTVGELAERLQIRHHSAVELVDRLAVENFLVRSPSAKDRRLVLVQLTRGGDEVLERLSAAHTEQLKTSGPELIRRLSEIIGSKGRLSA